MTSLWSALPRPWRDRYGALRRDVAATLGILAGRAPDPLVRRSSAPRAESRAPSALAPRRLTVVRVTRETDDAVTIHLADPAGASFEFAPGQFFTLLVTIDGEKLRRAYSASSSPGARELALTIKRVAAGRVSNHVNDHACEGMSFEVLGPSGSFVLGDARGARHVVMIAGGSGITPMMSIARTLLANDADARVSLVYGNRAERDVIFLDALAALASEHADRLAVRHVLSDPPSGWSGGVGLLDRTRCDAELDALGEDEAAEYFICGPEPMMDAARAALLARGIDSARIHEERFASPHLRTRSLPLVDEPRTVVVRASDGEHRVVVAPGQTLLEAALDAGAPMPFSCAMGGCGACKVKLVTGDVVMDEPTCLSDEERAEGYVLTCVGRPAADSIVVANGRVA
jgi:ferredoxin-NADP reductase